MLLHGASVNFMTASRTIYILLLGSYHMKSNLRVLMVFFFVLPQISMQMKVLRTVKYKEGFCSKVCIHNRSSIRRCEVYAFEKCLVNETAATVLYGRLPF